MSLPPLPKQPSEEIPCTFDFVDYDLPSGETIQSATVKVFDSSNVDQSANMVVGAAAISGTKVTAKIKGGTDGQDYLITFAPVQTQNYKFEEDVRLIVRERNLSAG